MAHASKKHIGPGAQGKGAGVGAMTDIATEQLIPDNAVLSNRDKAKHATGRGLDSKQVQTEQFLDHEANRLTEE